MALISKERILMRSKLLKKGDKVQFPLTDKEKVSRIVQDMNMVARAKGAVEPFVILFSVSQKDAPKNKFYVIRNH